MHLLRLYAKRKVKTNNIERKVLQEFDCEDEQELIKKHQWYKFKNSVNNNIRMKKCYICKVEQEINNFGNLNKLLLNKKNMSTGIEIDINSSITFLIIAFPFLT